MKLQLHIEELIVHGFETVDRRQLGAMVEAELARLFTEQGIPPAFAAGGEVARLDGGALKVASQTRPDRLGAQVAQAIYGGLTHPAVR